jgi:hypothetical protein
VEHVLLLDGRLHDLDLDQARRYPIKPTPAGLVAVARLERALLGSVDPLTMLPTPLRPQIQELLRLTDPALWIVSFRYGRLPARLSALRYREVERSDGLAVARACGHAVPTTSPGTGEPATTAGTTPNPSLGARAIAAAFDLHQAGERVTVKAVAERAGFPRNRTAIYRCHSATKFIKMLGMIQDGTWPPPGYRDPHTGQIQVCVHGDASRHSDDDGPLVHDEHELLLSLGERLEEVGLEPDFQGDGIDFRFLGRPRRIRIEDVGDE